MHVTTTMMKKSALLLFIASLLFLNAIAQKQNTYFLKNNGRYLSALDSADYIRIVREPEKGSSLYLTKEFYPNENSKSIGYSSRIDPPQYEGQFRSFYINGNEKQVLNYAAGKIIDTAYTYYPNGKLYSSVAYSQKGDSVVYIKMIRDSAGKDLVINGNGRAVYYDSDFRYIREEGNVKNGRPDGNWSGVLIGKDTLTYKEIYAEGKMLSGESTDSKGNIYHYTISEVPPGYAGGLNAFYKSVAQRLRYPVNLVNQRIQGVAYVSFVVLDNGEIGNVRVINQVHPDMAAEAIRVIKASKSWEPGIQKGRKVNVSYTSPISFSLGY